VGISEQDTLPDVMRAESDRWLTLALATATDVAPEVPVEVAAVDAAPVEALVGESAGAALLVVGTRGHGGFTGLLVGSTSVALAGRALCPLVVVRGDGIADGPVVVGVDGTPAGEGAIEFAFAEASGRRADLVAVHCWTDPVIAGGLAAGLYAVDQEYYEHEARKLLAERLAGWQEKYPDVRVTRQVVREHPIGALRQHADGARMVVVGSRGRGGFAGLVLGSTSQYLLHHAPCAVAVVRTDVADRGRGRDERRT